MPLWGQDSPQAMGRDHVTPVPFITTTPTFTPANSPTSTPSPTNTWNPFATPTWTFTPGSPTDTPTNTNTPIPTATFTLTGTLTPSVTPTPTWSSTPAISRASLALFPTAYSNAWDRKDGFNWDIGFTYFIGTIAEREKSEANADWLNPLRVWVLTSDLKYGWLDESGDMPGIASGLLLSELLNGGGGSSGGTTPSSAPVAGQNSTSFQLTGNSVGGIYTVASKTIAPGMAVHFGYIYGFNQAFQSLGIGDFAPNLNYGALLPLFTPKLNNLVVDPVPPNIFYTGFNTKMLGTNWKFEVWKPFPMDQNPVMFDSQIDGLFAFNLGYMRWDEGFAVLGYFNFRFTIIPVTPDY